MSQPKGTDQSRKGGWLLPPAWVVEEEARERLAPVCENTHESPPCETWCRVLFRHERQAYAINRSTDQNLYVIDDQRSVYRNR